MKRIIQWSIDHHWIVIGLSLLLCAVAVGAGAVSAAQLVGARPLVAFVTTILMIIVAGGVLLAGFALTAP